MGNRQRACGPVGRVSKDPVTFLVCFAVKEEAKFFQPQLSRAGSVQAWVTGMGRRNAGRSHDRRINIRAEAFRFLNAGLHLAHAREILVQLTPVGHIQSALHPARIV